MHFARLGLYMLFTLFVQTDLAAQSRTRGPLSTRKHFPTDLLYLSPALENAKISKDRKVHWQINYAQANSFVKSGSVLDILPETGNRLLFDRHLANQLMQRFANADAYFFDLEVKRISVRSEMRLSPKFNLAVELPFMHLGGGFMDGVIEDFHAAFGIPDDERPDFQKNAAQAFLFIGGNFFHKNAADLAGFGPGDVSMHAKYLLRDETRRGPAIAARVAVELPTGSGSKLHGNGKIDWGVGLLASKQIARNALYLSCDVLFPGAWRELSNFDSNSFFVLQLAYERLLGNHVSLLLQANSNSNPFFGRTDSGLSAMSHELTLGAKFDLSRQATLSLALSENYAYFRNSPDLGFQIGLELR